MSDSEVTENLSQNVEWESQKNTNSQNLIDTQMGSNYTKFAKNNNSLPDEDPNFLPHVIRSIEDEYLIKLKSEMKV